MTVAELTRVLPMAQNFLNFMQVFGKYGKIQCLRTGGLAPLLRGILDPPLNVIRNVCEIYVLNGLNIKELFKA